MGLGSMVLSFGARRLGRALTIRSEDDGAFLYSCDGQVLAVALSALRDGDAWPMGQGSVSQEFKRSERIGQDKGWAASSPNGTRAGNTVCNSCDAMRQIRTM